MLNSKGATKIKIQKHSFYIRLLLGIILLVVSLISCNRTNDKTTGENNFIPDKILINGEIITVDPDDSIAEAIAIKHGKIVAIGSNKELKKLIGPYTQVIDLHGLATTPGLSDSHCHFSETSMLYVLDLSYPAVRKILDVQEMVRNKIENRKSGEWIRGRGWDEGKLTELRRIYSSDLDPISPQNPVWLTHTMGHYGVANSYALKLANITKDTPDPPGGTIDRYPDGTPTGILKESAQSLVTRLIPAFTAEQQEQGITKIMEEFNKAGMTAVKDPRIDNDKWKIYQKLLAEDKLTVRIFCLWDAGKTVNSAQNLIDRVGNFTKPYISIENDMLISGGVKIFLDGSGGARTAWLYDEWNKDSTDVDKGNYGYPVIDPNVFRRQVKMFHDAGLHVSTHAIGDRAIDWTIESYGLALKENPVKGLRHGIIHCNIPTNRAIEMMADMQINYDAGYPESQPNFMWWIGDTYAGNFGPERSLRLNPFKTYLKKEIKWGGGSDFPVTPFPAMYGIWSSMARSPLRGSYGSNPFGKEESINVHDALRSYTIWNAHQLFLEDKIGSLEVGKYADIAVWDKNLYTIPFDEIKDLKCQMTMLGGKIVYMAPGTPIMVSSVKP